MDWEQAREALVPDDGALFHRGRASRPVELPELPAPVVDTHGHLLLLHKMDPAVALARAALAGLRLLIVPLDPTDSRRAPLAALDELSRAQEGAAELLERAAAEGVVPPEFGDAACGLSLPESLRLVAGVHPYGSAQVDDACLATLEQMLADPRCVGVGEFGLDYGPYNELPANVQEAAFRAQLRVAHEHGLPVQLHIRDAVDDPSAQAHRDAVRVLEQEGVPEAGVDLHCFTSGPEVLSPFVELGCHVAFGGAATFARSEDIRAAAVACPEGLILSETDCPYMAPVPLRGQECEPAMTVFSAELLATTRAEAGVASREATYQALWNNALDLFRIR